VSEPADSVVAIRALIGDAACDNDAQCRTVGIGARACGGPSAYLAWSSLRTDAQTIAAAAARQSEARRQELIARGAVSTCIALPDPGAYCAPAAPSASAPGVTHTCRLRPGGAGGPRSY
jgi:hypothetical protein